MKSIQKLREQRDEAVKNLRKLVNDSTENETEWTASNQAEYDKLVAVVDGLDSDISRLQKVVDMEAASQGSIEQLAERRNISVDEAANDQDMRNAVFAAWARGGKENFTDEHREWLAKQEELARINNAQSVGVDAEGGYTAHSEFGGELFKALKAFGGVRQVARIRSTSHGNTINWPTMNTTDQEGELIGENVQAADDEDVVFGNVNIGAFKFSSKAIALPWELIQDSSINIQAEIIAVLQERLGRTTNRLYTVGTGAGQPMGIVPAASLGLTGGSQAAVSFDDLIELEHKVDPAYRAAGQCSFMFHDQTLKSLKKLKDGDSRPIWLPGYSTGEGNQILGYGYTINQNMDQLGAGNYPVLFGRMSDYTVRDVMSVQVFRMTDSKYTEKGQVGFIAFMRSDGQFLGADNGSISKFRNAV